MDQIGPLLKLLLLFTLSGIFNLVAGDDGKHASTNSAGIQTNFGDVSFAGGMSYDPKHQIVYVTGQVGTHSCFIGILKRVPAWGVEHPTHLEFLSKQVFDEKAICQTIAFRKDMSKPGNALLLSLSEEGGLLTEQRVPGSRKAKQFGGMLNLEFSADGSSSTYDPDKSVLIYPAAVTIPRSIANDPTITNRVFIATMTSESTDIQYRDALGSPHVSDGGGDGLTAKPNLTPGGGKLKYGNNFAMTVESIRLATEFSGAEPQWRKPFAIKHGSDNVSKNGVTVNQIIFRQGKAEEDLNDDEAGNALYVVGSTLGSGQAFGKPEFDNDKGYGVVAGFIIKLDPNTGALTSSRRFLFNPNKNADGNESPLRDTYIEAVCDAKDAEDAIYIVGSYDRISATDRRSLQTQEETVAPTSYDTSYSSNYEDDTWKDDEVFMDDDDQDDEGNFDDNGNFNDDVDRSGQSAIGTPFIAKLRASTLETIWQKDFESTTTARALGCGVDTKDRSKGIYLAGNIENGGQLVDRTTTLLGDDVFLLKLDTADGEVSWSKQLGTSKDDRLAYGGSGLVVLEGQAGVLLMGDTTDNLYAVSDQDSEIFIVEIGSDGAIPDTTESTGVDKSPGASVVKISNPKKVGSEEQSDSGTSSNTPPDVEPDAKPDAEPDIESNENSESDVTATKDTTDSVDDQSSTITKEPSSTGHNTYLLIGVSLVAFAFMGFCIFLSDKKKREAKQRALVFSYLQGFDLEDIDVKQAATGGWHGTYVGSLAEGVNVLDNASRSSSDGSWDCGNEVVEQKLSKLSHSSVVRDILFMDYDEGVFSSVNADKNDESENSGFNDGDNQIPRGRDGILKDHSNNIEEDEDRDVDPWGTDII